ncbi:MAG: hypothetical protein KTR32_05605 [Granulosicoccus sp.]|nr:hypothetical protein [Granulosicoccus sp.]
MNSTTSEMFPDQSLLARLDKQYDYLHVVLYRLGDTSPCANTQRDLLVTLHQTLQTDHFSDSPLETTGSTQSVLDLLISGFQHQRLHLLSLLEPMSDNENFYLNYSSATTRFRLPRLLETQRQCRAHLENYHSTIKPALRLFHDHIKIVQQLEQHQTNSTRPPNPPSVNAFDQLGISEYITVSDDSSGHGIPQYLH